MKMKMLTIQVKIPIRLFGITLYNKKYRCHIPSAWSDINESRQRLIFVRYLALLPYDAAIVRIIRDLLKLSNRQFASLDPADIVAIADQLSWINAPTTYPIIRKFKCKGSIYALPTDEFINGTAYEFAQADDYYREWIEDVNKPESLLLLVATLARPYRAKLLKKTGDGRIELSKNIKEAEQDIINRSKVFEALDISVIVAVLRYFEGLKLEVSEYGKAVGIFNDKKEKTPQNELKKELFGWWTAYRTVAKALNKTEEAVWQTSLWRVLSVMIEEKARLDELDKPTSSQNEF